MVKAKNVHKEGNLNYFLLSNFFLYSFEIVFPVQHAFQILNVSKLE